MKVLLFITLLYTSHSQAQTFDYFPPGFFTSQSPPPPLPIPSPVTGRIAVTFKPHNDLSSIVGQGHKFTIWSVSIRNDYPIIRVIQRERIMALALAIHEIPGRPGEDLLNRQARSDPHNVTLRFIDFLLPAIAAGGITYGLLKKIDWATGTGLGSAAIGWGRAEVAISAPNVQPYLGDLLPKDISLAALDAITYAIVATYDPNPQPVEASFQLP